MNSGQTTGQAQGQTGTTAQTQSNATVQTEAGRTVTAQQQSTIQRSVLSARNAPRVNINSINFAVNRGVVVPSRFHVVSVAAFPALIDVFPFYRDDSFFIVEDEVVFLDRDRRVVDVVPVGPRTRFSHRGSSSSVAIMDLSPQQIREVQQVLIDRGLLVGEADGVLGSRTREALITFQRQQGIATSGSVDTRTVAALGLSDRIGQGAGQGSSTVGQGRTQQQPAQQNAPGQTTGRANPPQNQSTPGQSPAQQQAPQQNTTGQAAPQNQSTVGQGGSRPSADQNTQPGQSGQSSAPPSSGAGQGAQTPEHNSNRK
ncbi:MULTISPECIES: peptidoglycan-binding domain-containing protein [unclassified Bradyrhizobium]|uniref:peptidoglycan-binding domain-containing protein n=1 Tax=unclassified Bradyrhizobium TaxID=2631580 RepID=UPI002478FF41|nr:MULTISPECIES: peptidoglycan-binding domain-containing protein [unclassified Bradyrhizobium]WGS21800.1 peptidoglycan-binding protein [Bradyrhizobium sp. ISRA463]WGS28751.1 peptidoglycan-binding protein [Bradyrhizobium sp. ISRA464]